MHTEVEKIVWKYLHNHISEALENGTQDSFMMSRCFDLINKVYKEKFYEFPNGKDLPISEIPASILIPKLKKNYNISQRKVAAVCGVSEGAVCKWAKSYDNWGINPLPLRHLKKIEKLMEEA